MMQEEGRKIQSNRNGGETDRSRGYAVLLNACTAVFALPPDNSVVGELQRVAGVCGDMRFKDIEADEALVQRFHDRMFVTSSPYYVPLTESCIRNAAPEGNTLSYGSMESRWSMHVAESYRACGFSLDVAIPAGTAGWALQPDSLTAELRFVTYLESARTSALMRGEIEAAGHYLQLIRDFVKQHPLCWMSRAASCLAATDDDLYARTVAFVSEALASIS